LRRRIALITEIIAPYRIPVFNALAARDEIDLHVIFLAETDATQRHWLVYKDEIKFSYQVLPSYRRRIAGYNFLFNWGMTRALSRAAPAAILCGGYSYFATWRAMKWARARRLPFLLWSESNTSDRRSSRGIVESLKKMFIRNCNAFVVPGSSAREYLVGYGISSERIFVASNAVDNKLFSEGADYARSHDADIRRSLNLPQRYFLFVGRLVREKGVFDLVDAYQRLSSEIRANVGLVVVGNGKSAGELEDRAANISPGNIQIAGFAQRDELAMYYGLAEAFIFPTHSDPWGLVVNEAMACGLPILATDVAGCVADLVKEGQNGLVMKVGDIPGLVSAMAAVAEDPVLRKKMAVASSRLIESFSPGTWAGGIVQALETAAQDTHDA
jgi:glycosyltransferase involved in cell wall biosynthesis